MDMNKILENASKLGSSEITEENDISKEIMDVARAVQEKYSTMHPWFRGVDMIEKLKHLGKANIRSHLERLVDKHFLEGKLHNTKKVYRIRIVEETEDD